MFLWREKYTFWRKYVFYCCYICFNIFKSKSIFGYIAPIGAFDQTDTIIQFNEFSNVLIVSSLLLLVLFFVYYRMSILLSTVTLLDTFILLYYFIFFIIIFAAKFSHYEFSGEIAQLALRLSSVTFLQSYFLKIIPFGIILYIPIIYLFFIQKRNQ